MQSQRASQAVVETEVIKEITDERAAFPAEVTQHIVYFILLALIHTESQLEKRQTIYRLAFTSRAWRDLMLKPLNLKLNTYQPVTLSGKSTIEILRHKLFASAGLVILNDNRVVSDDYVPDLSKLIYLSPLTKQTETPASTAKETTQPDSKIPKTKRCYAVGIFTNNGLNKSFESDQCTTTKFKAFELESEAKTYVDAISDSVMGYSVSPRSVQPIHIQPRKLSSGGIDHLLSLQFFNVAEDEMCATTPPPEADSSLKYSRD